MNDPRFLRIDFILEAHLIVTERFGGTQEIRDIGLIQSALASAENAYYYGAGDLFDIAAAYAYHISESQAFLDGSKRTALTAAMAFLDLNDLDVSRLDNMIMHDLLMAVANKRLDKPGLAAALREMLTTI